MAVLESPIFYTAIVLTGLLNSVDIAVPSDSSWTNFAVRLTGESDQVRLNSIRKLKSIPQLHTILEKALSGPDKYLAMDVISALKLKEFLPALIQHSTIDENGAFHLAMNTLIDSQNSDDMFQLYSDRLVKEEGLSVIARVVILDTLSRSGILLPENKLRKLMLELPFEGQSAVLSHARSGLMKRHLKGYLEIVQLALASSFFQLRIQALFLIQELSGPLQKSLERQLIPCLSDPQKEVRALCQKVSLSIP